MIRKLKAQVGAIYKDWVRIILRNTSFKIVPTRDLCTESSPGCEAFEHKCATAGWPDDKLQFRLQLLLIKIRSILMAFWYWKFCRLTSLKLKFLFKVAEIVLFYLSSTRKLKRFSFFGKFFNLIKADFNFDSSNSWTFDGFENFWSIWYAYLITVNRKENQFPALINESIFQILFFFWKIRFDKSFRH